MLPWRGLLDLLYPPRCLLCQQPPRQGRDHFCEACATLFADPHLVCPRCAATTGPYATHDGLCGVCRPAPPAFDAALRLGPYTGPLRDAVLHCKRAENEGLAELLGERWVELRRAAFAALGADVVVPVPLHWWRRLWRGYNQSAALAWGLASRLGLPCPRRWLRRTRNTPRQTSQSAAGRRDNVRGAFAARPQARLAGKCVLLVDDVMTTGATAHEAARALKKAGARRVAVAVLARAEG